MAIGTTHPFIHVFKVSALLALHAPGSELRLGSPCFF